MPAPTNVFQPYAQRYIDAPKPEDVKPTALEIVNDLGLTGKLHDKKILITGATAGLGLETARVLLTTGAKLYLTVRDEAKGAAVVEKLMLNNPKAQRPTLIELDLSSLESVRKAVKQFESQEQELNILINNAGVMGLPEGRTVDGFETILGTNHFAHFLLFQLLKPTLLRSSTPEFSSRVVTVASAGHKVSGIHFDDLDLSKQGYNNFIAYAQSKTANIYTVQSIERHYGAQGLHGLTVHPGMVFSPDRQMSEEDAAMFLPMAHLARNVEQGAASIVWAALSPHFNDNGGFYVADAGVSSLATSDELLPGPGYAPHTYDDEAAEKLWKLSYKAVGLKNDEE